MGRKDITTIRNNNPDPGSGVPSCHVFEGFISFLSFLILILMGKIDNPDYASHDYIILNSVSNTGKALKQLNEYRHIFMWLDNDTAGKKATETVEGLYHYRVLDMSFLYGGFNDLNDYLCSMKESGKGDKVK